MKIAPTIPNCIWTDNQFSKLIGRMIIDDPLLTGMVLESDAHRAGVRDSCLKNVIFRYPVAGNA